MKGGWVVFVVMAVAVNTYAWTIAGVKKGWLKVPTVAAQELQFAGSTSSTPGSGQHTHSVPPTMKLVFDETPAKGGPRIMQFDNVKSGQCYTMFMTDKERWWLQAGTRQPDGVCR